MGDEGHGSTSAAYLAVLLCRLGRFDEAEELATIALATGADDDLAQDREGVGHPMVLSAAAQCGARSSRLRIFPDGLRGSMSMTSTEVGHL